MLEEKEIIHRVLGGRREEYRLLVERARATVFRAAVRYVGDPDDAEDIAQAAFIKAYESLARFRGESAFTTWVTRIAVREALDFLKRSGRTVSTEKTAEELFGEETDAAVRAELRVRLERAVESLPPQQKGAFLLRGMEGLSHREAALILGCTEGAVKAHYFHALRKLRAALSDLWREEGGV